jgi:hypothetical protein
MFEIKFLRPHGEAGEIEIETEVEGIRLRRLCDCAACDPVEL